MTADLPAGLGSRCARSGVDGQLLARASTARQPAMLICSLRGRWPGTMIDDMREIEVVVAHSERVTLRVGDVFLKIDTDQGRVD